MVVCLHGIRISLGYIDARSSDVVFTLASQAGSNFSRHMINTHLSHNLPFIRCWSARRLDSSPLYIPLPLELPVSYV